MNIYPVTQNDFEKVTGLLKQNNLPTSDITATTPLFALYDEGNLIGSIGLETYKEEGLLRSLCVAQEKRQSGVGNQLVSFIEDFARAKGIKTIYLLTTTAAAYFRKKEYQTITRNDVPDVLKQTSEFTSTCPASATVMKKDL